MSASVAIAPAAPLAAAAPAATQEPRDEQANAVYRARQRPLAHGLSAAQRAYYRANGFLILRGAFTREEAGVWQREADAILRRDDLIHPDNLRFDLTVDPETKERRVGKVEQFVDLSPELLALSRDRRILDPLAALYGGREPRLFKDKLIYKPPGSSVHTMHQDYNWWQGFPTSLISVLVCLDAATRANGCTELFPGYERGLLTEPGSFGNLSAREDLVDLTRGVHVEAEPGDIALFHCFAPHRAGPNTSQQWRRQIFLTYNDSADGEHFQAHREHFNWYVTRLRSAEERERKFFR